MSLWLELLQHYDRAAVDARVGAELAHRVWGSDGVDCLVGLLRHLREVERGGIHVGNESHERSLVTWMFQGREFARENVVK